MPRTTPLSAGLAVLILALAGCDGEVIAEPGHDEGRSGVAGAEDGETEDGEAEDGETEDGETEEAATDDGDDSASGDGSDDGADDGPGDDGEGGGSQGAGGASGEGGGVCDPENLVPPQECCPGQTQACWEEGSWEEEEYGSWEMSCWDGAWSWSDCETPLVLSFDGAEPRMIAGDAAFDLAGLGELARTDWPSSATPWLVLDRDGDGRIADGTELFGSGTVLASGARARHGFEALAELDADGSGVIDASDPGFASLALWSDVDGDRLTDEGELASIASGARRLVAIDLGYRVEAVCDARGNCGVERATFRWEDAGGLHDGVVVDVHLRTR